MGTRLRSLRQSRGVHPDSGGAGRCAAGLYRGQFRILQDSIAAITPDRRLQLLLIAFGFGAFFEGAAGFGTPVAVTGAMLIGLGFSPLAASGLSLIANTAPVAFGALGTPVMALSTVTNLDLHELSAMIGRQLPFFSVIVPFWLICAFAGWRGTLQIWPAVLVAGVASGGVMGKMIDAQSIVVASTATRWYGHESEILRYVFFHSIALALLVGLLVLGQAYVWPLTALVP